MSKLKGGKREEFKNGGDTLRCQWHTAGHGRCEMLGSIATNNRDFYCLWHYKSLNDVKWSTDYEQFLKWRAKLIENYAYSFCLLKETDCPQRPKHPSCNWDKDYCPPRGSQWHYDADEVWLKVMGGRF